MSAGVGTAATQTGAQLRDLADAVVEREPELAEIRSVIEAARAGAGRTLLIEAPAGNGKSVLLQSAKRLALAAGLHVCDAAGNELEADFPFGIAIQLFEHSWVGAEEPDRARLTGGPARRVAELLNGTLPEATPAPLDKAYPLIHGLFWFASNLALPREGGSANPTLMIVDDLQQADRASLRFLAYLGARLQDLPIALILAAREGEALADPRAFLAMRETPGVEIQRPASLSDAGVKKLVRIAYPTATRSFVTTCCGLTGGNPFLVTELLAQMRAEGRLPNSETAVRLAELPPETIVNSVVARLGSLSSDACSLANAVALLGDRTPLQLAAQFAELELEAACQAADELAGIHLLHPGVPLWFVHPVIRAAVLASIPPLTRGRGHRRAATLLRDQDAAVELIAGHLLAAPPDNDQDAVEILRHAARSTLAAGEAATAARMLKRALAEQPSDQIYAEALAELGQAEAKAGSPQASERLEDAIRVTSEPNLRAQLALTQGNALIGQGQYDHAARALEGALHELGTTDDAVAQDLDAAFISAAALSPDWVTKALARRRAMLRQLSGKPTPAQRAAVARTLLHDSLRDVERSEVRRLADLAWDDGGLLESPSTDGLTVSLLVAALLFIDDLKRSSELSDAVSDDNQHGDASRSHEALSNWRAWTLYEQGAITNAAVHAKLALDAPRDSATQVRTAYGAIASCHIQKGELGEAEQALTIIDEADVARSICHPSLLEVRAQLRLAQHRPREALEDSMDAGRRLSDEFQVVNPGAVPWRSTAALALLALGDADGAAEFAEKELERAKRLGVTRIVIRDLRILGLATGGARGLELLHEAGQVADRYPIRLESIHAYLDLGAALRRAKKRAESRGPLRKALELSHRNGASALAERAHTELAATGVRSRRLVLSGVDALTPSERRVATLAAKGMTTRQIAGSLYVTPKTVEYHLRHTYRKLDVGSRSELTEVLKAENVA